jgi:PKD repeat protein
VSRIDLPTSGRSVLPDRSVRARFAVVDDVSDVFADPGAPDAVASVDDFATVRVLYAPASASASPLDDDEGLVARGDWREAPVTAVGSGGSGATDASGPGLTLATTLDAGVAAGGRLDLAILVVDDAGNGARLLVENATAVAGDAPRLVVGNATAPATDPDDDGRFEDVDGDGQFSILDVVAFLDAYDGPTVQAKVARFDFDGNGRISILDVVALLEAL